MKVFLIFQEEDMDIQKEIGLVYQNTVSCHGLL